MKMFQTWILSDPLTSLYSAFFLELDQAGNQQSCVNINQAITWASADQDLFSHMDSLAHKELKFCFSCHGAKSFSLPYGGGRFKHLKLPHDHHHFCRQVALCGIRT